MECAGCLDILKLKKLVTTQSYDRGIQHLESIVAMLTKMV